MSNVISYSDTYFNMNYAKYFYRVGNKVGMKDLDAEEFCEIRYSLWIDCADGLVTDLETAEYLLYCLYVTLPVRERVKADKIGNDQLPNYLYYNSDLWFRSLNGYELLAMGSLLVLDFFLAGWFWFSFKVGVFAGCLAYVPVIWWLLRTDRIIW